MKVICYYSLTDSYINNLEVFAKTFKYRNASMDPIKEIVKKYENQYKDYLLMEPFEFWLSQEAINHCTQTYGKPNAIMNTFYHRIDLETDIPVYLVPLDFYNLVTPLVNVAIVDSYQIKTTKSFNFMANRKRINRHLLIKLLEHFDLVSNAEYTWSGSDPNFDLSKILKELDSISAPWAEHVRSTILDPIKIQPRWVKTESDSTHALVNITTLNTQAWAQGLNSIFNTTAVSLISESIDYQNGIGFTEKSAYPLLGLNLPIWVGGKYQSEEFEKLGYDVFNDYIDHSYQHCDSLIERCYRAIADNYKILSDVNAAADIRQKLMPRLLANRQLFLSTTQDHKTQHQNLMSTIAQLDAIDAIKDRFKLMADHCFAYHTTLG